MPPSPVFIGIDPSGGRRPINYAVLDGHLHPVAQGAGALADVLAVVAAYPAAVCAVDAPQSPNGGLMASPPVRARFGLHPSKPTWGQFKVCEYELKRRGIGLYPTPADPAEAKSWMRLGWELYAGLRAQGFELHRRGAGAARRYLEVHPHACFTALLGHLPFNKKTLEGRVQRQLLLYEHDVDVADPMAIFEEMTRHGFLAGRLVLDGLLAHDELDALVAAYTAYLAAAHPERVTAVGDPAEGQIVVPVAELRERYIRPPPHALHHR